MRRALENVVRNAIRYAPVDTDVELQTEDGPRASSSVFAIRARAFPMRCYRG